MERRAVDIKLLALLLLVIVGGFLGIDIHLASMPHIMQAMHTDQRHMQQSVSIFLLGIGLSLIFYGPLSDHFGRRPIVLFGLLLACVASFAAAWSHHIALFLFWRLLQGAGSGVCAGLGRIILVDMYQGEQAAQVLSYCGLVTGLSPLMAPLLGGYIQHWLGWQANFIFLGCYFLLSLLGYWRIFPETHTQRQSQPFSLALILHNYYYVLGKKLFWGCALLSGIGMASNMVYATTSAFILQHDFSLTVVQYGWATGIAGLGTISGRLVVSHLIRKIGSIGSLLVAQVSLTLAGLILAILLGLHQVNVIWLIVVVYITITSQAITQPCSSSNGLSPFTNKRGAAGALYGSFQQLVAFATSAIVAAIVLNGVWLLAIAYMVLGVLGVMVFYSMVRSSSAVDGDSVC